MMMCTLEVAVGGGGQRLPPMNVHQLLITDYLDLWPACVIATSEVIHCVSPGAAS